MHTHLCDYEDVYMICISYYNDGVDLNELAESHDPRIKVDVTRAYYFGSAYNCEMEIILPAGELIAVRLELLFDSSTVYYH